MDGGYCRRRAMTTQFSGRAAILFLDVEGGWGGSSRSLFHLIDALDRRAFEPVVLLRKEGPAVQRYAQLGIRCLHAPELAAFRPSERKNIVSLGVCLWHMRRMPKLLRRIRALLKDDDVRLVHVNHESLALSGSLIAKSLKLPWTCHSRTSLVPGWFARRLLQRIMRRAAHIICISTPVRDHVQQLVGQTFQSEKVSVIHNIVPRMGTDLLPLPDFTQPENRFRVLSLTNFSPNRGVDRIIDVAEILNRRSDQRFAFYLCGRPANTNAFTGRFDPYYESIRDKVRVLGLEHMVFFPGHVREPERALVGSDALIKLTRQSNPWGRDTMEALAAGLPIITLGTFQGFVENGINGHIAEDYRPEDIADYLQRLADEPALRQRIAEANKAKAERLFSPHECARATEAIYRRVLAMDVSVDKTAEPCAA